MKNIFILLLLSVSVSAQIAPTQILPMTSAELNTIISNNSGSGLLIFGTSPNITTPTGIVKGDVGLSNVSNALQLIAANNLSDVTNIVTARNNIFPSKTGNSLKFLRVNVGETDYELAALSGIGDLLSTNNLSDLANAGTARTNLGLGTLATQSGTFSGTSSGTNTGDNSVNTLYSGLVSNATHTGDATGATSLTVVGINSTNLAALATGILKNTTGTGVPSIATAGTDYLLPNGSAAALTSFPTLNQSTTGSAATLTTPRTIAGTSFDGSANINITHANLSTLGVDDHTQYALLAGRASGQTINGGNAANEDYSINGTSHATKTTSYVNIQSSGGLVGIGTTAPDKILEINLGTTDAFRLSYNDANGSAATYMEESISSSGSHTFNVVGSLPRFYFVDDVYVPNNVYGGSWDDDYRAATLDGVYEGVNALDIAKAPKASPTFSGTVGIPTPFTLGATSVTTTGTQLNYLNAATGTTGTTSTNVVYSASPTFTGEVVVPTVSTTTSPLHTSSGTVETTSEAGDFLEYDGNAFYGSTDADNRGYIPVVNIIRADATRTFANVGTAQTIFTTPTNGRLTLETGTYLFDGFLALTTMSATSGNLSFNPLGAGTATMAAILYQTIGNDAAANATAAAGGSQYSVTAASGTNVVTAGTQTALGFAVKGTFEITGAGTIIPSITLTTANAAVLSIGSYLQFTRIGNTSLTVVGQWD